MRPIDTFLGLPAALTPTPEFVLGRDEVEVLENLAEKLERAAELARLACFFAVVFLDLGRGFAFGAGALCLRPLP